MKRFALNPACVAIVQEGDITKVRVDGIVNAANERMLGGGGVDGAIHRSAGPQLVEACRQIEEVRRGVRCPRGEARITPGFNLPCGHVIHTVGPIFESAEVSAPILASAYRSSLQLANDHQLKTIAFPAISCGVYGYPTAAAARIAMTTCREHAGNLAEIRFVLFGRATYQSWLQVAEEQLGPPSEFGSDSENKSGPL
jgi:O-acetyl-ADP-ribose deacetylase (regulator of RNase III)